MRTPITFALLAAAALFAGCELISPGEGHRETSLTFTFEDGTAEGWTAGFADYPADASDDFYELDAGVRNMPASVDTSRRGFFITGNNHSDDLFMYLKRQITGLTPNATYDVTFRVRFASEAPSGCPGVGGSPGESVYLKAAATTAEPKREADAEGWHRVNIDKGNQEMDGKDAVDLGTVGNGDDCAAGQWVYRLLTRESPQPLRVRTDGDGALWVLVGTDSGFESTTSLYYDDVRVTLRLR